MRPSSQASNAIALVVLATAAGLGAALVTGGERAPVDPVLPFADPPYVLSDEIEAYEGFMMSGGPPPDGIPAIDEPVFVSAEEAELRPGEPVIGFVHGGEARAYPQSILVYHEIVNDRVGGLNVAISYCPLTATAQGFHRGSTTFGVSGQLLNSNLVLFDRESGSYFSQIAATGITGEHRGRTLVEVDLTWTTWERWRAAHPETRVLSERSGHLRNYARDPYGSYDPIGGYYAQDGTLFPVMHESDRHHPKTMVLGARTESRSVYFTMDELEREHVLTSENFLAVYDERTDTGSIYRAAGSAPAVRWAGDGLYEMGDALHAPDDLPMERVVSVEAFHFAWNAFYPESETSQ